jgi:hypothetical protein
MSHEIQSLIPQHPIMNHNIQELVALAATGKLTPEQWMALPPQLQQQLLPLLMQQQSRRSPEELRKVANQIAKGASWGLFTAEMQQLGIVLLWMFGGLVFFIAIFILFGMATAVHH